MEDYVADDWVHPRALEDDSDHEDDCHDLASVSTGRTLLPSPIASAVSFATRSTSFALRLGTLVGGYSINAAKITTLSSLELGRGILEGILSRAGRDVMERSRSELGRDDAETVLERSLNRLHQSMTQVLFWTSTGFHVTGMTVSTVSQVSQLLLSVLDQFFGSTDSSKAIASIITMVRREFQNPATGVQGETVGVVDIMLGLCGLAFLQSKCRKVMQAELRRSGSEEVIWDVVVLDNGERVDVHQESLYHKGRYTQASTSNNNDDILDAIENHGAQDEGPEDDLPEIHLKKQILSSLPPDASVSITTQTNTTKTITVEIKGSSHVPLLSPPGVDLVESEVLDSDGQPSGVREKSPTYRVVYRISRNRLRTTAAHGVDGDDCERRAPVEPVDDDTDDTLTGSDASVSLAREQGPPTVPPKATLPMTTKRPSVLNSAEGIRQRRRPASSPASNPSSMSPRSHIPLPKLAPENAANQKRIRQPLAETRSGSRVASKPMSRTVKEAEGSKASDKEKRGGLRNALIKGPASALGGLLSRDTASASASEPKARMAGFRPPWGSNKTAATIKSPTRGVTTPLSSRNSPLRDAPGVPQRGNPNSFSSRDLGQDDERPSHTRSHSRSSYIAMHDYRRGSVVSQTDTYSIHSFDSRPTSPILHRSDFHHRMSKSKSGNDMPDLALPSPPKYHHRSKSSVAGGLYSPSICTLRGGGSQTSLVLSQYHHRSAYSDSEAVDTLRRTGMVDGMFPNFHLLRNITRYSRYASAAYGSHFLKLMGIAKAMPTLKVLDETHHDVRSFAHHTELPADSILISSFVDPQGGSDSTGSTDTGVPLVHTITLDEESKAVVLSCRGTLGFEDVLADMMCDYDDLEWRGKTYKVHKGVHASARRLLYGGDGRVLVTLKEALEEFPDYGLILCGHSLGGAVTALLGAMLAEPAATGTAFVTSAQQHRRLLTNGGKNAAERSHICLPSGRPIHVYAYGPPATMSPSLQKATRGLITSTVHGNDVVPHLSLGLLHDFQALALAFKTDNNEAKAEVRRRIWLSFQSGLAERWHNSAPKFSTDEENRWAYAALKTLRANMTHHKLMPPGEVFAVECSSVMRRDAFVAGEEQIGRPATRIVLKYIRDVEHRFREPRMGASMLLDHSPGRYEDSLRRLQLGVLDV